jgi:hypothetical protein
LIKGFGGGSAQMRMSKMLKSEGFLGRFDHSNKLKVGVIQHMTFHCTNQQVRREQGPFYLSPEERDKKREDINREDELRSKLKSKTEMLDKLALKGILPEDQKNRSKEEVLALCADNGISCNKWFGRELKMKKGLQEVMTNIDGVRDLQLKREYHR